MATADHKTGGPVLPSGIVSEVIAYIDHLTYLLRALNNVGLPGLGVDRVRQKIALN